ncbi:hypothetical protein O3M35_003620 [Rhynocoris fuscipes]|uniref:Ionotropic glutamate receptor C-terminal domain-containing protein n=1 Tax=Rhynocoris fuscipes TaxID=488301 RepID=A0AAW1CKM8_9HEMI
MLAEILDTHMEADTVVILYDDYFQFNSVFQIILENLLKTTKIPIRHGRLDTNHAKNHNFKLLESRHVERLAFIVFSKDIDNAGDILIGRIFTHTKVILISQSSVYQVKKYLASKSARQIVNVLVVVDLTLKVDVFTQRKRTKVGECDIMLYSHRLYTDPRGNSYPVIVTAWRHNRFTRENVSLYPDKFKDGLNGLHLIVSSTDKPPFVFRKRDQETLEGYLATTWEGLEVRLIHQLGDIMNFTVEFKEPAVEIKEEVDSVEVMLAELTESRADLALGGIYMSAEMSNYYSLLFPHTQDCASFISLASTALPKYRAIMGPFLWDVWLALTFAYLLAMVPISFSVWQSFQPIKNDIKEFENMFWYVFGTFTNCFSFNGPNSWARGDKNSTKIFISTYWLFTIIITACYTGSIIAFITLPVYPEVIETSRQLAEEDYRLIVTKSGVWYNLLNESYDPIAQKLLTNIDFANDYLEGLKKVSGNKSSDRKSVFLGSKHLLEYAVRANYTPSDSTKRLLLHISGECFVPLMTTIAFPPRTTYIEHLNLALLNLLQFGYLEKITRDLHWIIYRSSTSKLLQAKSTKLHSAPSEDRELTLGDTQGMFLLLGAGFAIALTALIVEILVWMWKEIHEPVQSGKPTLRERILERIGIYKSSCKRCLLGPLEIQTTLGRIYQERRRSRATSQRLSDLFGSEISVNFVDEFPLNVARSAINLSSTKPEHPIRLRSF